LLDLRDSIYQEDKKFGGVSGDNASVILQDSSIRAMAKILPKNVNDFAEIDGIGKTRADKYGPRFLRYISEFCEKHPTLTPKLVVPSHDTANHNVDDFQSKGKKTMTVPPMFVASQKQQNSTRTRPTTTVSRINNNNLIFPLRLTSVKLSVARLIHT